jgi:D-glycero-D-manno-heptose 1,7-bisphosphate phosphatase
VARGTQKRETVEAINREIGRSVNVDDFNVCYHDDSDNCFCRKPRPGLILGSASKWSIDLAHSFLIGDRWRDIDAGIAAGCRTVFIDRGYVERKATGQHFTALSFKQATEWILKQARET